MSMEISFSMQGNEGARIDEAQALAAIVATQAPFAEPFLFGWLHLRHEGEPDLTFNDDLNMLFPRCVAAIKSLRMTGRAELVMASYYCHLSFVAEGDTVHLFQEDGDIRGEEMARYPKDEFIKALTECCGRFTSYTQALASVDPQWSGLRDVMAQASS